MKRSGILRQTIIIFAVSVLLISVVSTAALYFYAVYSIRDEQVRDAEAIAGDAEQFDDLTMLCLRYKG